MEQLTLCNPWAEALPRKLWRMRVRHGTPPAGVKCGGCTFYARYLHSSRTYAKCRLFGVSHGPGTDWSMHYTGCGAWIAAKEAPTDGL